MGNYDYITFRWRYKGNSYSFNPIYDVAVPIWTLAVIALILRKLGVL